jgi:hypothetical protein
LGASACDLAPEAKAEILKNCRNGCRATPKGFASRRPGFPTLKAGVRAGAISLVGWVAFLVRHGGTMFRKDFPGCRDAGDTPAATGGNGGAGSGAVVVATALRRRVLPEANAPTQRGGYSASFFLRELWGQGSACRLPKMATDAVPYNGCWQSPRFAFAVIQRNT